MNRGIFVIIFTLLLAFLFTELVENYEYKIVNAKVIQKEYDRATTTIKNNKVVNKPAEYEVTIKYKGIEKEFEFEDSDFYNSVEENGTVKVKYVKGFNKRGKIVFEYLELIED